MDVHAGFRINSTLVDGSYGIDLTLLPCMLYANANRIMPKLTSSYENNEACFKLLPAHAKLFRHQIGINTHVPK